MLSVTAVGLTTLAIVQCVFAATAPWNYEGTTGPAYWYLNYPDCGGDYQSPINIVGGYNADWPRPDYYNYQYVPTTMTLLNDGHTLKISSTHTSGAKPHLKIKTKTGKTRTYELDSVHFHWGKTDSEGNEHTFKGKRYPIEMHAVHLRVKNGVTVAPAQAVALAYVFEISSTDNPAITKVLANIAGVINPTTSATVTPFAWSELLVKFTSKFYLYKGSLTIPPCPQIVNFFIRETPLQISSNQMAKFRTLLNSDNADMSGNWRPIQPKNGRNVYYIH